MKLKFPRRRRKVLRPKKYPYRVEFRLRRVDYELLQILAQEHGCESVNIFARHIIEEYLEKMRTAREILGKPTRLKEVRGNDSQDNIS